MSDPFAPSTDPDIPTPTRDDLLRQLYDNTERSLLTAGKLESGRSETLLLAARRTWDERHKRAAERTRQDPKPISLPGGRLSPTPQEERESRLRAFLHKQGLRAAYDAADSEQKRIIWAANERAFEEAEKRKEQRDRKEQRLMAKIFDAIQRLKENPEQVDLLPPANASIPELKKWYEDISKPGQRPDYGDPAQSDKAIPGDAHPSADPEPTSWQDRLVDWLVRTKTPRREGETIVGKVDRLSESNLFWGGGVGIVLVGLAFRFADAPQWFSLALLIAGWLVISISIWRHNFFEGYAKLAQTVANIFVCFAVGVLISGAWWALVPVTRQAKQTDAVSQPTPTPTTVPAVLPLDVNRAVSLGNLIVMPTDESDKRTQVRIQLLPQMEDEHPERHGIDSILLSIVNNGPAVDPEVSVKLFLPPIRSAECNSDSVRVVDGGSNGSTSVQFLVQQLEAGQKYLCRVNFMWLVNDVPTVRDWKQKYNSGRAWSKTHGGLDVSSYRVSVGAEQQSRNPQYAGVRKMAFLVN